MYKCAENAEYNAISLGGEKLWERQSCFMQPICGDLSGQSNAYTYVQCAQHTSQHVFDIRRIV